MMMGFFVRQTGHSFGDVTISRASPRPSRDRSPDELPDTLKGGDPDPKSSCGVSLGSDNTGSPWCVSVEPATGSLHFNASSYVVLPDEDHLDIAGGSYTIEAWVKPAKAGAMNIIARSDENYPMSTWSHQLRINSQGRIEHYCEADDKYIVFTTANGIKLDGVCQTDQASAGGNAWYECNSGQPAGQ